MIGKIEELLNMDDYDLEAVFTPAVVNVLILDFVFTCTLLPVAENTEWWRSAIAVVAPHVQQLRASSTAKTGFASPPHRCCCIMTPASVRS